MVDVQMERDHASSAHLFMTLGQQERERQQSRAASSCRRVRRAITEDAATPISARGRSKKCGRIRACPFCEDVSSRYCLESSLW